MSISRLMCNDKNSELENYCASTMEVWSSLRHMMACHWQHKATWSVMFSGVRQRKMLCISLTCDALYSLLTRSKTPLFLHMLLSFFAHTYMQ